jgi:hypothetical protein
MIRQFFRSKISRLPDSRVRVDWIAWSGLGWALGRALTLAARGELDGFGWVGAQWPIAV